MKKSMFIGAVIVLMTAFGVFAQSPGAPLETILTESRKQSENYRETFKNLLADEFKTFEDFDKRGASERKTTVKSSFLVYQSGKSAASTAELRNILEVDGRAVPDSQRRGEEFLAELDKQKTLESELKKLQKESSKFDKTWEVYGLTLNQAIALDPQLRAVFDFQLVGTETYQGNEVYVIGFQQKAKSPNITVNERSSLQPNQLWVNFNIGVPNELKKTNLFLRGKLWIDTKTFQVWREERDLIARTDDPVVLLTNVFEYQTSNFGILVPKSITMSIYNAKKEKGTDKFSSLRDMTVNFEYSNFRQTNVEVNILDEETD